MHWYEYSLKNQEKYEFSANILFWWEHNSYFHKNSLWLWCLRRLHRRYMLILSNNVLKVHIMISEGFAKVYSYRPCGLWITLTDAHHISSSSSWWLWMFIINHLYGQQANMYVYGEFQSITMKSCQRTHD